VTREVYVHKQKKLAANRVNTQKSAGPKTEAGKQVAGQYAITNGLYAHDLIITRKIKKQQNEPIFL